MIIRTSLIALAIALPAAASAQAVGTSERVTTPAQTAPTVGATLYDPQGMEAGTIKSITPQAIVVNTGTADVAVPPNAVGPGEKGLVISLTKAQLNAAGAQAQAQAQAAVQSQLTPGASVTGSNGAVLGTIKTADVNADVILTTPNGEVALPRTAFGMGPNGLVAGVTAEQLQGALAGASGAAGTTTSSSTTTTTTTTEDAAE